MPAFCLLLLYSYYANNFAGKINASLVSGGITYLNLVLTLTDLQFAATNLVHLAGDPMVRSH